MNNVSPLPDAEALYVQLRETLRTSLKEPSAHLVGIATGGAWIAQRLHKDLHITTALGIISSGLHRDDYATRGINLAVQTDLPFEVKGADIVLIDDVLQTGRTIRAVINELYDFGRPKRVQLAVLVDRGERELPIQADFASLKLALTQYLAGTSTPRLNLQRDETAERFHFTAK